MDQTSNEIILQGVSADSDNRLYSKSLNDVIIELMDFTVDTILEQLKTSDMNALQKMAMRDAFKIGRKLVVKQFEAVPEEQLVKTFKMTAVIASELARRIDEWDGTQPELMAGEMLNALAESTGPVIGGDDRGTGDE